MPGVPSSWRTPMKTLLATTAAIMLATAASTVAVAQEADESTMAMADVPAAVMEAATAANATGTEFETVALDDGVHEFAGTQESDMGYEIDVMEDGFIEEIETQIDAAELPAEVAATVAAEMAAAELTYIEKSKRADGVVVDEFEGTMDGAAVDAEINADGTGYAMNDDMAG